MRLSASREDCQVQWPRRGPSKIGGARKVQGMASFADVLTKKDADAIHAYLNDRASEDWGEMSIRK